MHIESFGSCGRARRRRAASRRGFTLLEVMVALAIMTVLLVIIMVPLNLGVNLTQIGTARANTQQAAQTTMNRIVSELRRATFVFPNARMAGVTDSGAYTNNNGFPYYRTDTGEDTVGVCDTSGRNTAALPYENTSRIDILVPESRTGGQAGSIVTFYTRRDSTTQAWSSLEYDPSVGSIGVYRAQIPFLTRDGSAYLDGTSPNALVNADRYPAATGAPCSTQGATINRGTRWLIHNGAGEPQLAVPSSKDDLSNTDPNKRTQPASDTRIAPLGTNLYAPRAAADETGYPNNKRSFKPDTTFICEDTNGNGIIDRVTVTLVMGTFDGAGVENRAQTVRLTQAVDLPNVESRFGQAP
jgi:prepilin-type N-terminal cleavage/methylation domain-containing protein